MVEMETKKTVIKQIMEIIKITDLYIIGWGLGGGFGGIRDYKVIEATSIDEAEEVAWEAACNTYQNYVGTSGLRGISEIMEEEGIDNEGEAEEIFKEDRESWLDYSAKPYSKEYEREVEDNHYSNKYKLITDEQII